MVLAHGRIVMGSGLHHNPCRKPSFFENKTGYSNETGDVKDEWNTGEVINEHILPKLC